jgi:hypothetical protein
VAQLAGVKHIVLQSCLNVTDVGAVPVLYGVSVCAQIPRDCGVHDVAGVQANIHIVNSMPRRRIPRVLLILAHRCHRGFLLSPFRRIPRVLLIPERWLGLNPVMEEERLFGAITDHSLHTDVTVDFFSHLLGAYHG